MKQAKIQNSEKFETSGSSLTAEDLGTLKAAFPKENLGVKVQTWNKDRTRAMLVLYLQHTDVQNRLEEVDPAWSSEVVATERLGDSYYVRIRLTLKGVSRENVGEGADPKAAYSDALKRAAMLFGVGRYLYESETVWAPFEESRDRFKRWTIEDYERASSPPTSKAPAPSQQQQPAVTPAAGAGKKSREGLNRTLMNLYRPFLDQFPETRFVELLHGRYNVGETRLMTVDQLDDLVKFMQQQLEEDGSGVARGLLRKK